MFSKACKYAIRAMLYLAIHTDEDKKLGVQEIAGGLDVPRPFLAKILQQLTRCKLACSSKGRNGGFYLSIVNKKANLLQVIEAIDGSEVFTSCILGLPSCSGENPCSFHAETMAYRKAMLKTLKEESIQKTAERIGFNNFEL